jgi:hypothetical protein
VPLDARVLDSLYGPAHRRLATLQLEIERLPPRISPAEAARIGAEIVEARRALAALVQEATLQGQLLDRALARLRTLGPK